MKRSVLVVLGSARSDGNTADTARELVSTLLLPATLVDARELGIEPFDYSISERPDGFHHVIDRMLDATDVVLASPVYWYAMSGVMKTFVDRLTDLLREPNKTMGRALARRTLWVLATETDPALPVGFDVPFTLTAAYFDMEFGGACYRQYVRDHEPKDSMSPELRALASKIETGTSLVSEGQ